MLIFLPSLLFTAAALPISGVRGEPGIDGLPGLDGLQGEPGEPGRIINGIPGETGQKGERGFTGNRGLPGLTVSSIHETYSFAMATLRHYATSWKVVGSTPDEVIGFFI
jgi:hypothetical protein